MESNSGQVGLLELLIALDDAGCGQMTTDGKNIYIDGLDRIPSHLQGAFDEMRPQLLRRLQRVPMCYCRSCGGRPLIGHLV